MNNKLNLILLVVIIATTLSIVIKPKSATQSTNTSNSNINQSKQQKATPMPTSNTHKQYTQAKQVLEKNKTYQVTLKTTVGDITIKLDTQHTPITANNFAFLASDGFYNNTIFHRAIKGFMIQGGDPTGTGTGSAGYRFDDEYLQGEYKKGTVAMANSGPNTNGSQFFIMQADYPLPNNYVIFGEVIKGLDIVDKIATAKVKASATGEMSSPVDPVKIISTELTEIN